MTIAVALLGGCKEDAARDDAKRLVAEFCESAERCECAADLADGDCVGHRTRVWNERIDAGRERELTYDAECFESQVAAAVEQGCWGAGKYTPHLCESFCAVFHGSKALGADCRGFDEVVSDCAQGLVCADGTCVEPCQQLSGIAVGERCMTDEGEMIEDCADGLQCLYETKTCVNLPALGETCSGACAYGAWCDYNSSTCVAFQGEGEDCRQLECNADLYCAYMYDGVSETAVCQRYAAEGDSCALARCGPGLGCGTDQLCRGPGDDAGEPCSAAGCIETLVCDYAIDQCVVPPGDVGAACPLGQCGPGLFCDTMVPEPVCQAKIATGEPCRGHPQCESGYCPAAFCLERPALGEDCTAVGLCQFGLACDGSVCVVAAEAGPAACSYRGW